MLEDEVTLLVGFLQRFQLLDRSDLLTDAFEFLFELLNHFGILRLLDFFFQFVSLLLERFELATDIVFFWLLLFHCGLFDFARRDFLFVRGLRRLGSEPD